MTSSNSVESMYEIVYSPQFKKKLKLCVKRGLDMHKLQKVLEILSTGAMLPAQYRQHKLNGIFAGCWECHIQSDWLLLWKQNDTELVLLLVDTGTHSDLFG